MSTGVVRKAVSNRVVQHEVWSLRPDDELVFVGPLADFSWGPMVKEIEKRGRVALVYRGRGRHRRLIYRTASGVLAVKPKTGEIRQ